MMNLVNSSRPWWRDVSWSCCQSSSHREHMLYRKCSFLFPPDSMAHKTSHSWSAVFSSLMHGCAFDSIAVSSAWRSVVLETRTADVLFPRNALAIESAKSKLLLFSNLNDLILSFAQVQTVCGKIYIQDACCKSSSVLWDSVISLCLVKVPFHAIWIHFEGFQCSYIWPDIKKRIFCCCETWNYYTNCKPQEVVFILPCETVLKVQYWRVMTECTQK